MCVSKDAPRCPLLKLYRLGNILPSDPPILAIHERVGTRKKTAFALSDHTYGCLSLGKGSLQLEQRMYTYLRLSGIHHELVAGIRSPGLIREISVSGCVSAERVPFD